MDEIAAALSRLGISTTPLITQLPDISYNDIMITSVQERQLVEARLEVKVNPDHEVSTIVELFCRRWEIPICAAKNFMSLAAGNLKFPVLLLQNPSRNHDTLDFGYMVESCPTLVWLRDVLQEVGLHIDDVVILDVCPLLSDSWLKSVTEQKAAEAIREAYDLIERILMLLRPEILISCQCITKSRSTQLGRCASGFACELGSSLSTAKKKRITRVKHGENIFNIVQAYHPRSFIGRDSPKVHEREVLLREIISHFMVPCGRWKAEVTILLRISKMLATWLDETKRQEAALNKFSKALDNLSAKLQERTILRASKDHPSHSTSTSIR